MAAAGVEMCVEGVRGRCAWERVPGYAAVVQKDTSIAVLALGGKLRGRGLRDTMVKTLGGGVIVLGGRGGPCRPRGVM